MKKLYCLELNGTEEPKEINIKNFLSEETRKKIEKDAKQVGITLQIIEITNPEPFIKAYFEKKRYRVIRTEYQNISWSRENEEIKEIKELPENLYNHAIEAGVPDWFCFKSKNDWFFVEVKNERDGLRFNQVQWIIRNKYKTKVIFVEET